MITTEQSTQIVSILNAATVDLRQDSALIWGYVRRTDEGVFSLKDHFVLGYENPDGRFVPADIHDLSRKFSEASFDRILKLDRRIQKEYLVTYDGHFILTDPDSFLELRIIVHNPDRFIKVAYEGLQRRLDTPLVKQLWHTLNSITGALTPHRKNTKAPSSGRRQPENSKS